MRRLIAVIVCCLLALPAPAITIYTVDSTGGSTAPHYDGAHLQTALNDVVTNIEAGACADSRDQFVIQVDPAVTVTPQGYVLPARNETCSQWIEIRSTKAGLLPNGRVNCTSDAANLATISTANTGLFWLPAIATIHGSNAGTHHWRLRGLKLTNPTGGSIAGNSFAYTLLQLGGQSGSSTDLSDFSRVGQFHDFDIQQVCVTGNPDEEGPVHGIIAAAENVTISDSDIDQVHSGAGDAQAVFPVFNSGPGLIKNTHLVASGETIITGATVEGYKGRELARWTIVGNYAEHPAAWKYSYDTGNPTWYCQKDSYGAEVYKNTTTGHYWACHTDGTNLWDDIGTSSTRLPYDTKNFFEMKYGVGFQWLGNVMHGGWLPQTVMISPDGGNNVDSQECGAILFNITDGTYPSSDPRWQAYHTIADVSAAANKVTGCNVLYNFGDPISIQRIQHHRIALHDGLWTNAGDPSTFEKGVYDGPTGNTLRNAFQEAGDIFVDHNTVFHSATATAHVRANFQQNDNNFKGFYTYRNNVTPYGFYGAVAGAAGVNGACAVIAQINTLADGSVDTSNNLFSTEENNELPNASAVPHAPPCTALDSWGPGMQSAALASTLMDSTTFKIKAAYQNSGSDGRDPGANIDYNNAMTAHSVDGLHNPFFNMKVVSSIPTGQTTAMIYYDCPDTSTCILDISTSPQFGSHVSGYPFTDAGGNPARTRSVTGLSAHTMYYVRLSSTTFNGTYPTAFLDSTTVDLFQTFQGGGYIFYTQP